MASRPSPHGHSATPRSTGPEPEATGGSDTSAPRSPELPVGSPEFLTTRWSVVVAAGATPSPRSREALDSLARSYWYPIYAFVRRKGHDSQRATDLTQGFFLHLLDGGGLAGYRPERGRFRSYLRGAVAHFLSNEREREGALKRGGGAHHVAIDTSAAEERYGVEPGHEDTPEREFDRQWAHALLENAHRRLREEYAGRDQDALFEALLPFLDSPGDEASHARAGEALDMKPGAVRVAIHRLRKRYGLALRTEVAGTVRDPGLCEDELEELLRALAR